MEKIKSFILKEKIDFWDELSNSEKQEIKQGIKDLEEGRKVSWKEVQKNI